MPEINIFDMIIKAIIKASVVLLFAFIGFFNGIVLYIWFHSEDLRNYSASIGANTGFWWPYVYVALVLLMDWLAWLVISDECDIHFKIDCLRGDEE